MACNFTTAKFAMAVFISGELQFQDLKQLWKT